MKFKILNILLLLLVSINVFGQLDRSKKPEPGPAPEIKIAAYESFELPNGLKVFVVENHKLPKVTFSLVLDKDPILEGDKAGYLSIAGELLSAGTKTRTKEQLDEEVDFIGASFSTYSSGMSGSSLKKHTKKLLELMSDVLLNPAFPKEELEKIRKQTLSALALEKDDPNSISNNVSKVFDFGKNHPYGEVTTEETVKNITLEDCKNYYKTFFRPNIAYLAIVGDINKKEAKSLIKQYFGQWEKAEVPKFTYPQPTLPQKRIIALVDRPNSVQSVIEITHPVELKPGEPEVIKSRLMNDIIGGSFTSRLNMNLREKHGYTYGAKSSISPDKYASHFSASAKVRNEVTDSAIHEMIKEINLMEKEKVMPEELQNAKNYITGSFARSLENPQTVASFAINTARYHLPKDYYANYLKNVEKVTQEEVLNMAKKFLLPENSYIIVVGKADEIAKGISGYGEIKYFDMYGNEVEKSSKEIPTDITPEEVYQNYIKAIGGIDKVKSIKDVTTSMNMNIQGASIEMVKYDKIPNKSLQIAKMGDSEVFKMIFDGIKGYQLQMGQRQDLSGSKLEDAKIENTLFYEVNPTKYGINLKMLELSKVNKKDAFKIEATTPAGTKIIQYFDKETGLKVKEEKSSETAQGIITEVMTYSNYTDVNGVKFPFKLNQSSGGMNFDIEVKNVEINQGLKDQLFTVE